MPVDYGYEGDDGTYYDGMDTTGGSTLGGYEELPSDTTTYDGGGFGVDDGGGSYDTPSDTTTY